MNANIVSMEHYHRQSKTISFSFILGSRCSSCLEIPILWQEVGQDLTDSNERQQLHLPVWESMLDPDETIKAAMRLGMTRNTVLYGKWLSRIATLHLVGAGYDAYNFFILHFCTKLVLDSDSAR